MVATIDAINSNKFYLVESKAIKKSWNEFGEMVRKIACENKIQNEKYYEKVSEIKKCERLSFLMQILRNGV